MSRWPKQLSTLDLRHRLMRKSPRKILFVESSKQPSGGLSYLMGPAVFQDFICILWFSFAFICIHMLAPRSRQQFSNIHMFFRTLYRYFRSAMLGYNYHNYYKQSVSISINHKVSHKCVVSRWVCDQRQFDTLFSKERPLLDPSLACRQYELRHSLESLQWLRWFL